MNFFTKERSSLLEWVIAIMFNFAFCSCMLYGCSYVTESSRKESLSQERRCNVFHTERDFGYGIQIQMNECRNRAKIMINGQSIGEISSHSHHSAGAHLEVSANYDR